MNFLIPVALFCWIPLTIYLFLRLKPHHAAMVSVIGGTLFLPMAGYDLPGLPAFTKNSVVGIGLILGSWFSGQSSIADFNWSRYDIPMFIWCLCPLASSLSNNLGVYDGLAGVWENMALWGAPYVAGRIYINTIERLKDLCVALVIGGLLYMALSLYEIRMSPQLSNYVYGIFPHSWLQHSRYGGWRPIVFMQHGLMVALWMAATTTIAFWLWRFRVISHLKGIPISWLVLAMLCTTVLCKSANGWITLILGITGYFIYGFVQSPKPFHFVILLIPCYMLLRITGGLEAASIETLSSRAFDENRVSSLAIRLRQEDLFIDKMLQRPLLGWGTMSRAWPRAGDEREGNRAIEMIDALWLIVVSTRGLVGLVSITAMMLIGPWRTLSRLKRADQPSDLNNYSEAIPMVLSLVVILFMIDCLVNGMINPVYILVSGSLLGWSLDYEEDI